MLSVSATQVLINLTGSLNAVFGTINESIQIISKTFGSLTIGVETAVIAVSQATQQLVQTLS